MFSPESIPSPAPQQVIPSSSVPPLTSSSPDLPAVKGGTSVKWSHSGGIDLSVFDILNIFCRRWFLSWANLQAGWGEHCGRGEGEIFLSCDLITMLYNDCHYCYCHYHTLSCDAPSMGQSCDYGLYLRLHILGWLLCHIPTQPLGQCHLCSKGRGREHFLGGFCSPIPFSPGQVHCCACASPCTRGEMGDVCVYFGAS
jgi:hypothetical protein